MRSMPFLAALWAFSCFQSLAQSLELMPGTERIFADAQWLRTFDEAGRWSLFSRARATADYEENTDLFTGAYLNYTTRYRVGATVLGRISSTGAGGDAGIHYFRANRTFLVYALASIALQKDAAYSWFSIVRFTPSLTEQLRLYSSLELYSLFDPEGHIGSVQRLRAGLDWKGYQGGLAVNLSGRGTDYGQTDTNPGIFIRKQF